MLYVHIENDIENVLAYLHPCWHLYHVKPVRNGFSPVISATTPIGLRFWNKYPSASTWTATSCTHQLTFSCGHKAKRVNFHLNLQIHSQTQSLLRIRSFLIPHQGHLIQSSNRYMFYQTTKTTEALNHCEIPSPQKIHSGNSYINNIDTTYSHT